MKTKLFELIGEIDEKYIEEADTTETPRRTFKRKQYWKVAIACICISILMLFTSICIASGWGTEIIEFYSIGQENYNESGYEMGVHIQKISERSLKGDIRKSKAIIKKQYKLHTVFSNWMPGHYQEEFRSQTESIDYVGYKGLREIRLSGTELGSTVNVYANAKGKITNVNVENLYLLGTTRVQLFADIYTNYVEEDVTVLTASTEKITFREEYVETKNGNTCHVIYSSAMESGYLSIGGYIVENDVLYSINIPFLEENEAEAANILETWTSQF